MYVRSIKSTKPKKNNQGDANNDINQNIVITAHQQITATHTTNPAIK